MKSALPELRFCALLPLVLMVAAIPGYGSPLTPPGNFRFDGSWSCDGKFVSTRQSHRSQYVGRTLGNDSWLELDETDVQPAGYIGHYVLSFDSSKKLIVETDTNNAGYAIYSSPGWDQDSLTLTGQGVSSYNVPPNRFVYKIMSPDSFSVTWETNRGQQWRAADYLECKRSAGPTNEPGEESGDAYLSAHLTPDQRLDEVFFRAMSYNIPGSGETVGRQSGTAEYTVSSFSPAEIVLAQHAHFDGGLDDSGKVVIKDHGRTICYKDNCSPATDASGVLYNPLMWGDVPNTIRVGMQWEVPIGLAWEFGPPGKQTVTVIALDPKNHAVTLKREGFGDGPHADDPKTVSLRKDGKVVVAQVIPGKAHWIGLTVFQSGIVVSDELLMERPVTYQSDQIGKVTGSEREYMLLNESPVESH